MIILELFINAMIAGVLLGGFFAALSIGLSICFGLLDTVNIAHPTFIVAASFCTFILNGFGIDPILAGIIITPLFFVLGWLIYSAYYQFFEKTSAVALRGLAFFFGLLFITEVVLIMVFGVDHRLVNAPYIGESFSALIAGMQFSVPYRLLVAFVVAGILTLGLQLFLDRSFFGRATRAVHQDMMALSLMGVDPVTVKRIAFAIGLGTCGIAGALMIMIVLIVISACLMFSVENAARPGHFDNISQAIWWAVVTLTTVGYGDITPAQRIEQTRFAGIWRTGKNHPQSIAQTFAAPGIVKMP